MKRIKKIKYPDKTSINLLMPDEGYKNSKVQIAIFIVFMIFFVAFTKFAVIDRVKVAYDARNLYEQTQQQIDNLTEANREYESVREQYSHYGNGYLNEEEKAEIDRLDVMAMVEGAVMSKADIDSLDISENVATLIIGNTRLNVVSEIVENLERDSRVSYVTVSTAGTKNSERKSQMVTATVVVNLVSTSGGEEQ